MHWARYRTADGAIGFGIHTSAGIAVHQGDMFAGATPTGAVLAHHQVSLLAPCLPSKIVALWNNFHELRAKLDKQVPTHPLFLIKPATCVCGPEDIVPRPRTYAGKVVYEGELAIVIGRRCKDASLEEARAAIFGYTCVNDVTAAEILNETPDFAQWCRAKGFDGFGCLGPVIATSIELDSARIITRLNDAERQNYPLSDMIIPPDQLVSDLSHDMTLLPGDVIACGTSLGVGSMKDGSRVEVAIDGIGVLRNTFGFAS